MHFHVHVIPKYGKAEGLKIEVGTKYLGDIDNIYGDLKKTIKKHI
jgi:diadenosine tetraphosphate (Ap4A) HIT family hydrolase